MSIFGMLERAGIYSDGERVRVAGVQTTLGRGKNIYVDAAAGNASNNGLTPTSALLTLPAAVAKITTGKNDIVRVLPGASALNLAAGLDWSYNCSHLVGEGVFGLMNQRARIGHSANFATLFTVSGYGNSFQDLYFAHGRGNAGNLVAVDVTGARNSFLRCHFGGPFHATEAGTAGHRLVKLESGETYFKDCIFGQDSVPRTAACSMVEFGAQAEPPRSIFENCLFLSIVSAVGGAGSTFLKVNAGAGAGLALFRNCSFINIGSQAMTLGIDGAGLGNFKMHFENCSFLGCTDVVAAANEASVSFQAASYVAADETNGIAQLYDHTA